VLSASYRDPTDWTAADGALLDELVHLLGPVASMGQRVLQPIVNQQVTQVLGALEKQVQEAKAR